MLLHYLGKLKIKFSADVEEKNKQIAFLIASNFVFHTQILIFSVFEIAILSPYSLQIKFSMSLFFYVLTSVINCGTGNSSKQASLQ